MSPSQVRESSAFALLAFDLAAPVSDGTLGGAIARLSRLPCRENKRSRRPKGDLPPSKWGEFLGAMTVIATMRAGFVPSEMTHAQHDRSHAAKLQSKSAPSVGACVYWYA